MNQIRTESSRAFLWLQAMRPQTLWAGVVPVFMASAMATDLGKFHLPSALAALAGALLLQIGANFANDYFDFKKGADTPERVGPIRLTQAGLISPQAMKGAMIITFALVFVPGVYILYRGGPVFLAIGLLSILSAILYTGGPLPLGYLGLGDLFVLIFFGPVALGGTYYLQVHDLPLHVLIAGLAPGLFSVAILTVNNIRDVDGDRKAGKLTLAVRYGTTFAKIEYVLALTVAAIVIPAYLCWQTGGHYYSLAAAAALIPAFPTAGIVLLAKGSALNVALASTGKCLMIFGLLFAIGWVI